MSNLNSNENLATLREGINQYFDKDEFILLCADLEIDHENLSGDTKIRKAHELVRYMDRRGELEVLVSKLKDIRPNFNWTQGKPKVLASRLRKPLADFISRHDSNDTDWVVKLEQYLQLGELKMVSLWGSGGVGKTSLAIYVANRLKNRYNNRVVWIEIFDQTSLTEDQLLNEVAKQLGSRDLLKLAQEDFEYKRDEVRKLLDVSTLIVIDDFHYVREENQKSLLDFLDSTQAAVLITTRARIDTYQYPNVINLPVDVMHQSEADCLIEMYARQEGLKLDREIYNQISLLSGRNPLLISWICAQLAQDSPSKVFEDLAKGDGDAAERIFNRSLALPQVGKDGRDVLLALLLFIPDASLETLAVVANVGRSNLTWVIFNLKAAFITKQPIHVPSEKTLARTQKAVYALQLLRLIKINENGRVCFESLTYSLAFAQRDKIKPSQNAGININVILRFINCFYHLVKAKYESGSTGDLLIDQSNLIRAANLGEACQSIGFLKSFVVYAIAIYITLGYILMMQWEFGEARKYLILGDNLSDKIGDLKKKKLIGYALDLINILHGNWDNSVRKIEDFNLLDKDEFDSIFVLIASFILQKDWNSAHEVIKKVEVICLNKGTNLDIASLKFWKSQIICGLGNIEKGLELAEEAISIAQQSGGKANGLLANVNWHSGVILIQLNNLDKARVHLNEGIRIGQKIGNKAIVETCKVSLGDISLRCNEFVEAKGYYKAAIIFFHKTPEKDFLADLLFRLAYTHRSLNELELAENYYSEAATLYRELGREKDCISMEEGIEWVKQQAEYARKI